MWKTISDWFNFKTMASPVLIKVAYILGMLMQLIACAYVAYRGVEGIFIAQDNFTQFVAAALVVLSAIWFVAGAIILRLLCEFAIVAFEMNSTLKRIEKSR